MAIQIKVPTVGESITEVTLASWLVEDGDYVEMDDPLCELESDKATFELPAEKAGTVKRLAEEGDDLEIGAAVAEIDTSAEAPEKKEEEKEEKAKEEPEEKKEKESKKEKEEEKEASYAQGEASPAAMKLIREHDLDTGEIKGSGKDGRITKQDVQTAIKEDSGKRKEGKKEKEVPKEDKSGSEKTAPRKPVGDFSRETRREKMSRLRRTIADRLVSAKNETAMLTTFNEINMEPIMEIRKAYKEKFKEKHGVGLGFMSFFCKAVSHAVVDFPAVNASIDDKEIIYHDYCDISIAVSTPRGLVVPVIRNAESLSMAGIEEQVIDLATRGRENELSLEEMQGGTFTITNGGVFGSLLSTPILNAPQSAILGMHKIEERPIAIKGQVVIKPMMYVALSYDHRIVDGKESVSFLVRVKEYLENPASLLVGGDPVKELLGM